MSKQPERESLKARLWIGLAKVEQASRNGVLGDADRAYTNALAIVVNRVSFRAQVQEALAELGLRLIRLEDAETLDSRSSKYSIDQELTNVAKEAIKTRRVGFGTFHAFDAE